MNIPELLRGGAERTRALARTTGKYALIQEAEKMETAAAEMESAEAEYYARPVGSFEGWTECSEGSYKTLTARDVSPWEGRIRYPTPAAPVVPNPNGGWSDTRYDTSEEDAHYLFHVPLRGYPDNVVAGFISYSHADTDILDLCGDPTGYTYADAVAFTPLPAVPRQEGG